MKEFLKSSMVQRLLVRGGTQNGQSPGLCTKYLSKQSRISHLVSLLLTTLSSLGYFAS